MTVCVLDADLILYKASAAGEERSWDVKHIPTGKVKEFKTKYDFNDWLKEANASSIKWLKEDFEFTLIQRPDELANCLHTVKLMIQGIKEKANAKNVEIYIGEGESFRASFDLPRKYKSGRETSKPIHFQAVKDYIINKQKAIVITDLEVDDVISCRQWEGYQKWKTTKSDKDKVVAATVDKDAKQSIGHLLNWDKMDAPMLIEGYGKLFLNEKGDVDGYGRSWAFYQCLYGDKVDALVPYEIAEAKFGEKAAFKLLQDCTDDKEAVTAVVKQYREWYANDGKSVAYKTWDGRDVEKQWWEIMDMYWRGIFMLRYEYEKDIPPLLSKIAKNYGVFK